LSDSGRISAEKLARAEAEKRYWKEKRDALILRNEYETQTPEMFQGLDKRLGVGKPTPLDRAAEAHTRGIELNMFQRGLNGGEPQTASPAKSTQLDPNVVVEAKATIVKALAPNHTPEQIASYLEKISPFLDTAMLAGSDPLAQSLLYAKVMSSNQQQPLGLKDVIELVSIINQAKSQQSQTADPASVMNAAGNLFRTGVETARGRNDGIDMSQVLQMQQQSHDRMIQAQQEHFKEIRELQQSQPTLVDSLRQYRDLQGLVGTAPDRPEVAMKRLDPQAASEQRDHEWRLEAAKSKGQAEMIKNITGGLSRALENPVVRELGRSVGSKIGVTDNPLAEAQTKAAQQQIKNLADPLKAVYGFTCGKCRQSKTFSELRMSEIKEAGGRWMCDSAGCGEVYSLGDLPGPSS